MKPNTARSERTPTLAERGRVGLVLALCASACAPPDEPAARLAAEPAPRAPVVEPGPTVLFLGDSLTAGFGLAEDEAFPALVRAELAADGLDFRVVNAGVSGDTTSGGLDRIDWILKQEPDVVVLALGANDGLRGQSTEVMESNLRALVTRARRAGARVLLCGMLMPPNYGSEYADAFRDVYPRVAEDLDVPLVPFLLEGVAGEGAMNLPDGIHPNAKGHRRVARNVAPHLRELLSR